MRRLATVGLVAAALLLAGCSSGDGAADTAAGAGTPSAAPSAAPSGAADFEAYRKCLSDNGVDISALGGLGGGQPPSGMPTDLPSDLPSGMPTDRPMPSGIPTDLPSGGPGGGAGSIAPDGVDQQTWQAAQQACADLRPSFGPGMRGPRPGASSSADYQVFWSCMADHDVQRSDSGLPADLDAADAAVKAALAICGRLLPPGTPSGS